MQWASIISGRAGGVGIQGSRDQLAAMLRGSVDIRALEGERGAEVAWKGWMREGGGREGQWWPTLQVQRWQASRTGACSGGANANGWDSEEITGSEVVDLAAIKVGALERAAHAADFALRVAREVS